MNTAVETLAGFIAGKASVDAIAISELQAIVNQHPYFSAARLLLDKKRNDDGEADALKYSSLYLPDILLLNQLMSGSSLPSSMTENSPSISGSMEGSTVYRSTNDSKPAAQEYQPEQIAPDAGMNHEMQEAVTSIDMPIEEQTTETNNETEEAHKDAGSVTDENNITVEEGGEPEIKLPAFRIEPIDPAKAALSFEPYHTVDYFASQGIRMKEEEVPRDRFSKQLKSFTEWIRTMKKIPPGELAHTTENVQEEKKVEQMAAVSISDQRVVTETMAEVWEKQGDLHKAVEVYEKLSLLEPSKNAYFAAKIEQLKKLS